MSSALAIAAVTASLRDRLYNGLLDHELSNVGSVSVTAKPPDQISKDTTELNQLNLFLYQVTPNLGWRNADLPSRDNGGTRVTNPPLALDLHYLLTAYGAAEMNAEILLGYGMQLLHQFPGSKSRATAHCARQLFSGGWYVPARSFRQHVCCRPRRPGRADQDLAPVPERRRSVQTVDRDAGALPALHGLPGFGGADPGHGSGESTVTSPEARPRRPRSDRSRSTLPDTGGVRPDASVELPAMRLGDDLILTGTNLGGLAGANGDFRKQQGCV